VRSATAVATIVSASSISADVHSVHRSGAHSLRQERRSGASRFWDVTTEDQRYRVETASFANGSHVMCSPDAVTAAKWIRSRVALVVLSLSGSGHSKISGKGALIRGDGL
jgi:hypothetical protein